MPYIKLFNWIIEATLKEMQQDYILKDKKPQSRSPSNNKKKAFLKKRNKFFKYFLQLFRLLIVFDSHSRHPILEWFYETTLPNYI